MAKQEYVMLLHHVKENGNYSGWWLFEKMDGLRCLWDGGASIGKLKKDIPWAKVSKNDLKTKRPVLATGLWTRAGNPIYAPEWFIKALPVGIPLDGELYLGKGMKNRQALFSATRLLKPGAGWTGVTLRVFDIPPKDLFGFPGDNYREAKPYREIAKDIQGLANNVVIPIPYIPLPNDKNTAMRRIMDKRAQICSNGGEGVVVRNPDGLYVRERSHNILKCKPWKEAEGTIVGFIAGKQTDKGSRYLGMIGGLLVEWKGKVIEMSGMDNVERELMDKQEAIDNPGKELKGEGIMLKRGLRVSFRYRVLSKDKIPQEARYYGLVGCDR